MIIFFIHRYFGSFSLIILSCVNIIESSPGLLKNLWWKYFDKWALQNQPPAVFYKKKYSEKFHKIHRKTPVSESFLIKLQASTPPENIRKPMVFLRFQGVLRPATLFQKRLWHRCSPVNFAKFLRTPFLQNTSQRLLLALIHHFYFVIEE